MRTTKQSRRKEGKLTALRRRGHVLRVQGIRNNTAGRTPFGAAAAMLLA